MEKLLHETFADLRLTARQQSVFEEVYVERLCLLREQKRVEVHIVSEHIIPYREIALLEYALNQLFDKAGFTVQVTDRFRLSEQYTPENFWQEYQDSILMILKESNVLEFNMFYSGECHLEGETLYLCCDDDILFRARETEVIKKVQDLFSRKAGFSITLKISYREPQIQEEEEISYRDVIQHKNQVQSVEAFGTEKAQGSERGSGTKNMGAQGKTAGRSQDPGTVSGQKAPTETVVKTAAEPVVEKKNDSTEKKAGGEKKTFRGNPYSRKGGRGSFHGNVDEECFYGRNCDGNMIKIADIQEDPGEVVIEGMILSSEERELKSGKILLMFNITDFTDTIQAKIFLEPEVLESIGGKLKNGKFIKLKGIPIFDTFSREITISSVRGIKPGKDTREKRMDIYEGPKRVELHAHTQMSEMDSVVPVREFVKRAKEWGHPAVAITDHGVVQSFPDADHEVDRDDAFKVIYGVEAYLVDDLKDIITDSKGQSLDETFVVFDLETTGFSPDKNKIIEIGAVKVVGGVITDRFSTFVNPEVPIPFRIEELTSIKDDMVIDAPKIEEILPEFMKFCDGAIMVAHNAEFDMSFIKKNCKDQGIEREFTIIDTVALARILLPNLNRFKLDTVAKALNVSLENHHRAVDDAACTAEIFVKFIEMLKERGMENLDDVNHMVSTSPETVMKMPTYHAIILATNDIGRINLYRLVSLSHLTYYNKRPRVPKSEFVKYREGLLLGSACEAGELYRAIVGGRPQEEIIRLVKFYDYLEIQPLGNNEFMLRSDKEPVNTMEELQDINRRICKLGEEFNKLVVATCDVHFLDPEDEIYRRIIMAGKGFKDADEQAPLYLRTTEEMLKEFEYLGSAKAEEVVITNPNKIADMCEKIAPVRPDKCPPFIENSDQMLRDICYNKAHSMYGEELPPIVKERLDRELNSIISNGYAVMYIIAQKLVWKSNEDGYLVGSRGSVGSSFAATMSGITEVNPLQAHYRCEYCKYSDFDSPEVKAFSGRSGCDMPDKICPVCGKKLVKDGFDIPFETFLGFKGNKEPDIDLNFSGEYQSKAHAYCEVIFGYGQTFRAGTIGTLADKTAFGYIKNYYEERGIHKRNGEIDRIVQGCVGVRRTTGQHPGGIVVLPVGEEINTFTPVQHPANDMTTATVTTHFDYHSIDHNLLKLDILGHDDPTMIRMLQDLTGLDPQTIPLDDQTVMSLFMNTSALGVEPEDINGIPLGCLGIPEFGTDFAMQMVIDAKPTEFSDLIRISGLSHGTDVWLGNAQTLIEQGIATISTAICTRDDIMIYLIGMGLDSEQSFTIMESVRKGKGLKEEWKEEMRAHNVPEWYIDSCLKIKYMFPKAHAAAYVMMAWRIAYCKVFYPLAYYAAYFSIRATGFNYEIMCQGKERLEYFYKDYTRRKDSLSKKEQDVYRDMRIVQEMYARGFDFTPIDIYRALPDRFQIIDGKLMPALNTIEGMGDNAAIAVAEAAKDGKFLSKDDFRQRTKVTKSTIDLMADLGLLGDMPESNQLSLFDFA